MARQGWAASSTRDAGRSRGPLLVDDRPAEALKVADVMVRDVIAVGPDVPIHQAAWMLVEHGLPGLPVVDMSDRVLGVVTEQDLIGRLGARCRGSWWPLGVDDTAREYRRAVGTTAEEIMTTPAVTAAPSLPLPAAVRLFEEPEVGVVAVTATDRIVGTLRRRDLVRRLIFAPPGRVRRPDAEVLADMEARMRDERWLPTSRPVVHVEDGVIELWGLVDSRAQKLGLEAMARAIPGCRRVESHLISSETMPWARAI